MTEYEVINEITSLIKFILGIQTFIIIAFIIQFIANIVIIFQVPKIKKYNKLIYLKLYEFEDNDNEESTYNYKISENEEQKIKENITKEKEFHNLATSLEKEDIEKIIMWILIGIFFIMLLLKFIS